MSAEGIVGKVGKFNICFRDVHLSSHAGMALLQGFIEQLGVAEVLDTELKVKQRERGYSESESVLGLAHNVILGGECLSDLKVVRGDPGTQHLIGADRFIAPTTAGEFLRKFDLGDIQDMRRVNKRLQARVRPKQQASCCTLDRDSSIDEQASKRKQGSTQTYTGEIGDHPLFAFWEEEEELVFSPLRRGRAHTARKAVWFLTETLKCIPSELPKKLRTDSGFYMKSVVTFCETNQILFGLTADQTKPLLKKIDPLLETEWEDLERYGVRQVAELRYRPTGWAKAYRFVVKREVRQKKEGALYFHYSTVVFC